MDTWTEYFITVGVLLLVYCLVRFLFFWGLEPEELLPGLGQSNWNRTADPCKPIDASQLSARITCVRQAYQAELQPKTMSFKRAIRVRTRRDEIAQKAFFAKSASVETPQEDQDAALLSV